jgi:hypothetical protein
MAMTQPVQKKLSECRPRDLVQVALPHPQEIDTDRSRWVLMPGSSLVPTLGPTKQDTKFRILCSPTNGDFANAIEEGRTTSRFKRPARNNKISGC